MSKRGSGSRSRGRSRSGGGRTDGGSSRSSNPRRLLVAVHGEKMLPAH